MKVKEFWRKTVHMAFGLLITLLIWSVPRQTAIMVLGAGLLVGLWLIDLVMRGYNIPVISDLVDHLERPDAYPGMGAFFFVFSSLVTLILFPSEITAIGVLVLSVLDGMATLLGLKYGKTRIIHNKTMEGTGGAIFITFVILLFLMNPVQSAVIACIAGIVELASPIDDNLLIPPVIAVLLTLIPL